MKINGINEYVSNGFYTKPCNFREIIEAQKSRSCIPGALAALMGTRRIQNLYCDEVRFYDRPFPGPFSSVALSYYTYTLLDTSFMDNYRVFKIYFQPKDINDPGLYGYVYISEDQFKPLKIEADLNSAAMVGGSFGKVSIVQQFQPYSNNIYLPVDYRVTASSNYIGVIKMEYVKGSVIYKERSYKRKLKSGKIVKTYTKEGYQIITNEENIFQNQDKIIIMRETDFNNLSTSIKDYDSLETKNNELKNNIIEIKNKIR